MKITIFHFGGTRKIVELEDITPTGWAQVRYPNGGGCYRFALAHGRMERARGEESRWALDPGDLEKLRELARERNIKWRKPRAPGGPTKPRATAPSKQVGLFDD